MYQSLENEIFHIHTWRCKHASEEADFRYVEKAMELGADRIVFTDHGPFPGNPFEKRMDIEQLPEYIQTMRQLKREYAAGIEVLVGLEIEYLPSFHKFYQELFEAKELDLLMIGQHFYENPDGSWSHSNKDKSEEYKGKCVAIVQGIETGFFDVVAHPDRCFSRRKVWDEEMQQAAEAVIAAAIKNQVTLERNYSSMRRERQYWEDFWTTAQGARIIGGYDSHWVDKMEEMWNWKHATCFQFRK